MATGCCKTIANLDDRTVEENTIYFKWSFTTSFFDIIYMDNSIYWQIEEFTPEKLCITEIFEDPIEVPGQTYRKYKE